MHDVIIVGGSYAGISAAIQLGRARRDVLVIDGGKRRNRFAAHSHGFLGHDGASPDAIAAKGRTEALAYPTVAWREAQVERIEKTEGGFLVDGIPARRVILAIGVVDEPPAIPGIAERWGKSVFVCPYCHGYELGVGHLGVIAAGPMSLHHVVVVAQWAEKTTFFLNDSVEPTAEDLALFAKHRIVVERSAVTAVTDTATVHLANGERVAVLGLFVASKTRHPSPFAEQLGCELENGPVGPYFKVDPMKETTVSGVFSCGDAATMMASVAIAVADGALAGVAAHRSLFMRG